MGLCFLTLSGVWVLTGGQPSWYLPLIFLAIYGIFFASTGINMLVLNTLTGKLIKTRKRGQLSLFATVIGAALAVSCAAWLLGLWLGNETDSASGSRFELIFAFTGSCFLMAAAVGWGFRERPDRPAAPHRTGWQLIRASASTLKHDRNFLLLACIAALFGMSLTLFPHYQRLARERFDLGLSALIPWVIAQNVGAALFSIPAGWIADRCGTRLALRSMMLIVCLIPLAALALVQFDNVAHGWFTWIFGLLGLTPITMRIFNYYTLEVATAEDHPKYLSTLSIAMAIPPILFSSLLGALIDAVSFEFVFVMVTAFVLLGWVLTLFLQEPRHEIEDVAG